MKEHIQYCISLFKFFKFLFSFSEYLLSIFSIHTLSKPITNSQKQKQDRCSILFITVYQVKGQESEDVSLPYALTEHFGKRRPCFEISTYGYSDPRSLTLPPSSPPPPLLEWSAVTLHLYLFPRNSLYVNGRSTRFLCFHLIWL